MKPFTLLLSLLLFSSLSAQAVELTGIVGYDLNLMSNKPSNATGTKGGVVYGFSARINAGPGQLEGGFLYTPLSVTTTVPFLGDEKSSGSYWLIPLLYRFEVLPPFLSIGIGPDYAFVGSNTLSTNFGNYSTSAFSNNLGAEASLQATQDLGENLSAVLDIRYRMGLQDSITFNGSPSKFNFLLFALGLQKRLE